MDKTLKQRLVGASVLIALGVIFIPMLLKGPPAEEMRSERLDIPERPERELRSRLLPLNEDQGRADAADEGSGASREPRAAAPGEVARDRGSASGPSDPAAAGAGGQEAAASADPERGARAGGSATQPARDADDTATQGAQSDGSGRQASDRQSLTAWVVQVGSFAQADNATELRDELRAEGYSTFIDTARVNGSEQHRVRVGPEMDREEAERVRGRIAEAFDIEGMVMQHERDGG